MRELSSAAELSFCPLNIPSNREEIFESKSKLTPKSSGEDRALDVALSGVGNNGV